MKAFILVISWDRLTQGEFPKKDLITMCPEIHVDIERISVFKQSITLTCELEDTDDPIVIAYEIGNLIGTNTTIRFFKD